MNNCQIFFLLFIFLSCTPVTETNWPFLPSVSNTWKSIQTFGGSKEDVANAVIISGVIISSFCNVLFLVLQFYRPTRGAFMTSLILLGLLAELPNLLTP